jgi:predicted nucleic acid-binding protein
MTEYKRIFVDTAPIIYYLENSSLYNESIKSFFKKCIEEKIKLVTSTVTVEEYLAFP